MGRRIKVVSHDPGWSADFEAERQRVTQVFSHIHVSSHHIGSTSVPGLMAKPVIDILIVVSDDSELVRYDPGMIALGYLPRGECLDAGGTPGRFYYSRTVAGTRTHQVHVCRAGHPQIRELLHFARYLREHPAVAQEYGALKMAAIQGGASGTVGYMARKHDWIRSVTRTATEYYEGLEEGP